MKCTNTLQWLWLTLCVCLFAGMSSFAEADTRIFVQNNTPFTFESLAMAPSNLRSASWEIGANEAGPAQRAKVFTFKRDKGITSGKEFEFTTRLRLNASDLYLRQKVRGLWVNSHLWQSISGPGFDDPWFDDRGTHHASWMPNGVPLKIQYRAYFTGTDDDIE